MRYEGMVYRPPSEANSVLIQATIGCPHNKCTFCNLYKGTKFRIRSVDDIKEDLRMARDYYGEWVESLFFPDGNTLAMKTHHLQDIFSYASELFPHLERITVYGSARFVNRKSENELLSLRQAGLGRIHTGMESGDDFLLEKICKGTDSAGIIEAGLKLKAVGIEASEYYLCGIGGRQYSQQHALNSARVLSAFSPEFIRIRTFIPQPGTPIYSEYQSGELELLSPHEAIREVRLLVENLHCQGSMLYSDHVSNYVNAQGLLPEAKPAILKRIDRVLEIDESRFRRPAEGRL